MFPTVCLVTGILLSSLAATANAAVIARHSGAADPVTEGFRLATCCDPPAISGTNPSDLGFPEFSLNAPASSTQSTYQSGALTSQQLSDSSKFGWKLSLRARVLNANTSFHATAHYDSGTRRYDMGFGFTGDGYVAYVIDRVFGAQSQSMRSYVLPDTNYHLLELIYNPATQSAALFVDGTARIPNYSGHTDYLSGGGLVWGVVYGPGQGNFNLVQLETGPFTNISSINVAGGGADIAQNTWIEIKGTALAPDSLGAEGLTWSSAPEFASGKMPVQLGGVSVKVNAMPAYVYYVSPAQVNVLTPLDPAQGAVPVQLTNGANTTAPFSVNMKVAAPAFLLFGASKYIAATHANGSLLGPASMSAPGYTFTPAKPGETIVLYGVGFGLPSTTLTGGSATQTGVLPAQPVIRIGSTEAAVAYAGVISPGLYQFNVTVPLPAAVGDNSVTATYGGFTTAAGSLIAVQSQ